MAALHSALSGIRAVVFDLDGVLYEDQRPVPRARETVAALASQGVSIRFLTNTTSKSRRGIADKLAHLGFDARPDQIFTPGYAAGQYLRERSLSAHLLVQPGALEEFDGVRRDDEKPGAVVVGDIADAWTYERLNHAFRLILEQGAQLIGLGRSPYWRSARGLLLDVGPFLAALEFAARRPALVFGKPEAAIFAAVASDLQLPPAQIVMVGDDVLTDVQPAQQAGLRGVLVRTGKFREADLQKGLEPDLVLDSVADLLRAVGPNS